MNFQTACASAVRYKFWSGVCSDLFSTSDIQADVSLCSAQDLTHQILFCSTEMQVSTLST